MKKPTKNLRKTHKKSAYLENLGKIGKNRCKVHISGNLLDRIQNRVSVRFPFQEAAYIEALLYKAEDPGFRLALQVVSCHMWCRVSEEVEESLQQVKSIARVL